MSQKTKKGNYKVGYAKPPKHSRFQPGKSGNPSGRPKTAVNLAAALKQELQKHVVLVEHGRRKRVTKLEAAAKQVVNMAVAGDQRALNFVADGIRAEAPSEDDTNETTLSTDANRQVQPRDIFGTSPEDREARKQLFAELDKIYGLQGDHSFSAFTGWDQHSQCERISANTGTREVRGDGRSPVETIRKLYGLDDWKYERKPVVPAPVPQEPDRSQGSGQK